MSQAYFTRCTGAFAYASPIAYASSINDAIRHSTIENSAIENIAIRNSGSQSDTYRSGFALGFDRRAISAALFFVALLLCGPLASLHAQDSTSDSSSARSSSSASEANDLDAGQVKPALALESSTTNGVVRASNEIRVAKPIISSTGLTQVGLEFGLERVAKGAEPQTLDEFRALESQQAKVVQKVKQVTVNVQQGNSQGSGVIISGDGYVLTAAHVAGKPNLDATVVLSNGRRYRAKTLGMNRNVDAGLLKITDEPAEGWPHASLGESSRLAEGCWCVAVGHPGGWQEKRGSVVRVGRVLAMLPGTIVTDCSLIGGDSGGPLFDLSGRLIGIHSRIGADVTENMHVPVDEFTKNFERLVSGEKWGILPGYEPIIGITGDEQDGRAIITKINPGGPAERAGMQVGDVVVRFDGAAIHSFRELKEAVHGCLPGDHVRVEVSRENKILSRTLVIGLKN